MLGNPTATVEGRGREFLREIRWRLTEWDFELIILAMLVQELKRSAEASLGGRGPLTRSF